MSLCSNADTPKAKTWRGDGGGKRSDFFKSIYLKKFLTDFDAILHEGVDLLLLLILIIIVKRQKHSMLDNKCLMLSFF